MTISIAMLRCFAAVAQSGNLADAGIRLGRTQSAISMTLKQLEEHLDARLFETDRKNRLTPIGEEVFDLAQTHLRQYEDTIGAIETVARAPKGLLRLMNVPSVANHGLPDALGLLLERHPALELDIRDADTDIVTRSLLQGQADVGIVSGQPALNGIRQTLLFEDAFGLVCAPDHPLIRRERPPEIDDLLAPGFVRNNLCALIQTEGFQSPLRASRITARNTLSLISMVRTGKWITVLPSTVIRILPGHLAFREINGLSDKREVSLLVRDRCLFPDIAQELAEILCGLDWVAGGAGPETGLR